MSISEKYIAELYNKIQEERPIKYLLPEAVEEYIYKYRLYRQ